MQSCENCHTRFKWSEIYNSNWMLGDKNGTITCRECGTKHHIKENSKLLRMLIIIPLVMICYNFTEQLTDKSFLFYALFIFTTICMYMIVATVFPLFLKFQPEKKKRK